MSLNACTSIKASLLTRFTDSKLTYSAVALDRSGFPLEASARNKMLAEFE